MSIKKIIAIQGDSVEKILQQNKTKAEKTLENFN